MKKKTRDIMDIALWVLAIIAIGLLIWGIINNL